MIGITKENNTQFMLSQTEGDRFPEIKSYRQNREQTEAAVMVQVYGLLPEESDSMM